jgi:hypothetical protein
MDGQDGAGQRRERTRDHAASGRDANLRNRYKLFLRNEKKLW